MPAEDQTIESAMGEVSESDFGDDETTTTTDDTGDGETQQQTETDDTQTDQSDEGDEDEGQEEDDDEDVSGSFLSDLDPAALAAIKASPELSGVYKTMERAVGKRLNQADESMRLVQAYNQDPRRFVQALAQANGYTLVDSTQQQQQSQATQQQQTAAQVKHEVDAAGKKLQEIFGEKLGPQIGQVFEDWFKARVEAMVPGYINPILSPIKDTLGQVISQGDHARMTAEEAAFVSRHRKVITPQVYDAVVALGKTGQIVPGQNQTVSKYLDTLLEVVLARNARAEAKRAKGNASKDLAARIQRNAQQREPSGVGTRSGVKQESAIKPGMSLDQAFDIAAKELESEGR